jgi:hypothetical protein
LRFDRGDVSRKFLSRTIINFTFVQLGFKCLKRGLSGSNVRL